MARIQIADINPSESELLYELNDGEISQSPTGNAT